MGGARSNLGGWGAREKFLGGTRSNLGGAGWGARSNWGGEQLGGARSKLGGRD
jgi:hypothetical protein